jgi:hypothetical protein
VFQVLPNSSFERAATPEWSNDLEQIRLSVSSPKIFSSQWNYLEEERLRRSTNAGYPIFMVCAEERDWVFKDSGVQISA